MVLDIFPMATSQLSFSQAATSQRLGQAFEGAAVCNQGRNLLLIWIRDRALRLGWTKGRTLRLGLVWEITTLGKSFGKLPLGKMPFGKVPVVLNIT